MTTAKSPAHFRFWIFDSRWSDKESINRVQDRAIMYFSLDRKSAIEKLKLLNDPIRLREHLRRNRQADYLGCFQIDDELEFRWLLDWNVGGRCAFQYLVDKVSGAPPIVRRVRPVAHQTARLNKLTRWVHRRQPVLCREVHHLALQSSDNWTYGRNERLGAFPFRSRKYAVMLVKASHLKLQKFDSQRLGRRRPFCDTHFYPRAT